ncbi:MAG: SGNH/GDSL hydrolase family protein [Bacteroidota bacterium]
MKNRIKSLLLAIFVITTLSCREENCTPQTTADTAIRILPLGDSRVEGATPDFDSYRYELWKLLTQNAWETDFVGSREDDYPYAEVDGKCFDKEHEGSGGAMTGDIIKTLQSLKLEKEADVALLGIGGNDLVDGGLEVASVIDNMKQIISALQARNDSVIIFVEQIAPGRSDFMTADLQSTFEQFNQQILDLVDPQTSSPSKVIVINMAQDWQDAYMADEVHYSQAGAQVVAKRYFEAIQANVVR